MRLLEFWRPIRVIVTKRVSEEEQVSIESYCASEDEGISRFTAFIDAIGAARRRWNDQHRALLSNQIAQLDAQIEARGDELRNLHEQIEKAKSKLHRVN